MRFSRTPFAWLAAALSLAPACNAIFGIGEGLPQGTGGAGGTGGHGTGTSTSTSTTGTTSASSTSSTSTTSSSTSTTTDVGSCTAPGTASCAGAMLTICDKTGHATSQDCGAAALCDPAGQVCATHGVFGLGQARGCLVENQSVYCWGNNGGSPLSFGSLLVGDSRLMLPTPTLIAGVTAVQVAVADVHQCALQPTGTVTCWGNNQNEVLGSPDGSATTNVVSFPGAKVAVEIGVASGCTCARLGDTAGSVWCWGLQDQGCFGDGTAGNQGNTSATPHQVPLPAPAVQIRIGDGGTTPSCARLATQEVYCWGAGFGPTRVTGVTDALEIAVGNSLVFVRRPGGVYVTTPVAPPPPGDAGAPDGGDAGAPGWSMATPFLYLGPGLVTQMAAGYSFCAIETGNAVACTTLYNLPSPLSGLAQPSGVTPPGPPVEIAVGYGPEFASTPQCLRISGAATFNQSVFCWGSDDLGQLGVGGPEYPDTAQAVTFTPALSSAVQRVTCGESSTNVTLMDGSARYWGNGGSYLPGGPQTTTPSPTLTDVGTGNARLRPREAWGVLYALKSSGGAPTLYLQGGSSVPATRLLAWGTTYQDAFPGLVNTHVDMGLLQSGQIMVYADGAGNINGNDCGLFGDGTFTTPATPTLKAVPLPTAATALVVSANDWDYRPAHACALTAAGLYCWGSNRSGESGIDGAPLVDIPTPTVVSIPGVTKPPTSVAKGFTFTCATDGPGGTGQVYCWGANDYGQLGNGGYSSNANALPAAVQGINNGGANVPAAGVVAGDTHACAWLKDGTVKCWGCNDSGQVGSGDYLAHPTAVPVKSLTKNVMDMSAFSDHTCALYADGTVACWGSSHDGQGGTGFSSTFRNPTAMAGLP